MAKSESKAQDDGGVKPEVTQAPARKPPRKVSVARLISQAGGFLGVESHVAAGALHGVRDPELTVDEARQRIDAWRAEEA